MEEQRVWVPRAVDMSEDLVDAISCKFACSDNERFQIRDLEESLGYVTLRSEVTTLRAEHGNFYLERKDYFV